eukprot:1682885-Karenia_brevis.AAC.1
MSKSSVGQWLWAIVSVARSHSDYWFEYSELEPLELSRYIERWQSQWDMARVKDCSAKVSALHRWNNWAELRQCPNTFAPPAYIL